jgi:hypothetical protein
MAPIPTIIEVVGSPEPSNRVPDRLRRRGLQFRGNAVLSPVGSIQSSSVVSGLKARAPSRNLSVRDFRPGRPLSPSRGRRHVASHGTDPCRAWSLFATPEDRTIFGRSASISRFLGTAAPRIATLMVLSDARSYTKR